MTDNSTLPWRHYVEPQVLAVERRRLFLPSWQYVGHVGMLAAGPSYFPADAAGVPVVVTRDRDGGIGALLNVCAHRGSVVCAGPGERERLRCPYHAWTYRLDGSLVSAPRSDREERFDGEAHQLPELRASTWGPFIFVSAASEGPSLVEALGDVPRRVGELFDVGELVFYRRTHGRYRANWKVCVENYLECYHCRVAHPEFARLIDTGPGTYHLEAGPGGSSQYGPVRRSWSGALDPLGPVGRSQFHLVHPNTTVNVFPGHPNLSIGPVNPEGPGSTRRFLDYFFGPDVDDGWIEAMVKMDDTVGMEDRDLVESVQRGMESGMRTGGTLFLDSEALIAHFRDYVLDAVADTGDA